MVGLHPVGPPPGRLEAGSVGMRQAVSGRAKSRASSPVPSLVLPNCCSSRCYRLAPRPEASGNGRGAQTQGLCVPFPLPRYLERTAYPHHGTKTVAIVTEEKLIFSLWDITDVDINLEGRMDSNGVSSTALRATQLLATSHPAAKPTC